MKSAILWFVLSTFGPAFVALILNDASKLCRLGAEISDEPPVISVHPLGIAISSIGFLGLALATTLSVEVFPFEMWVNKLAFLLLATSS